MVKPKAHLVRYADGLIITAPTIERAEQVKETVKRHMAARGLQLSKEKTRYWKTEGNRKWVFKDKLTLLQPSDTKIIRHTPLKLEMNPYIDRNYFYFRKLKLLANQNCGTAREQKSPSKF